LALLLHRAIQCCLIAQDQAEIISLNMVEGQGASESHVQASSIGDAPSSTNIPSYPPAASTLADNEAGGVRRKPRINRLHKLQDIVFLVVFALFGLGFIVETSFGFNRGNPLRYFLAAKFLQKPPFSIMNLDFPPFWEKFCLSRLKLGACFADWYMG